MVEERSTERGLKELIEHDVVRCLARVQVLVDRQLVGVVDTHRRPGRIAAGHIAVLLTTVQLVLLLIEAVDEVASTAARQALTVEDAERMTEQLGRDGARRGRRGNELVEVEG